MVDALSSVYNGAYGYSPYSSTGRQGAATAATITIETEEETGTAQIDQGGKQETLSYASYSESVTIDVQSGSSSSSAGSAASSTAGGNTPAKQAAEGQQALATVEQTAAEARDFLKNDAKAKLQIALNELKLLKLLGNTPADAKEAAQIAKQLADASSEYVEGGGADIGTADSADATDGASADASTTAATGGATSAATTADGADVSAQAAAALVSGASQTTASADAQSSTTHGSATAASNQGLTPAEQDPFFELVQAALKELKKYLLKTLPALEASSDKKTRETAKKAEESFNESVGQIGAAEAQFDTETTDEDAADASAALGGADSAASAAAVVVAGGYAPVNLSV